MASSGWYLDRIPVDVLKQIILKQLGLKDLIRFGAVSRRGRSFAAEIQRSLHPLPWLLISRDEETQIGSFLSLWEAKIYNIKLTARVSESYCCGSTERHLIMADGDGNYLFDPFSQNSISLPQQYVPRKDCAYKMWGCDERCYFLKAIICSPPASIASPHVVAIGSNPRVIEMCRPHDSEWSVYGVSKEEDDEEIDDDTVYSFPSDNEEEEEKVEEIVKEEAEIIEENKGNFEDILLYKGMLHGLTRASTLVTFDLCDISNSYKVLNVTPIYTPYTTEKEGRISYRKYLIESFGELLMVHRYRKSSNDGYGNKYITVKIIVYKLDQSNDPFKWIQINSLGDRILFLGRNPSITVCATSIPRFKGNCIYFTDDIWPHWWLGNASDPSCLDNGVFYLDDGRIEPFDKSLEIKCQPIWITPDSIIQ